MTDFPTHQRLRRWSEPAEVQPLRTPGGSQSPRWKMRGNHRSRASAAGGHACGRLLSDRLFSRRTRPSWRIWGCGWRSGLALLFMAPCTLRHAAERLADRKTFCREEGGQGNAFHGLKGWLTTGRRLPAASGGESCRSFSGLAEVWHTLSRPDSDWEGAFVSQSPMASLPCCIRGVLW